jgi:hypothetical protein
MNERAQKLIETAQSQLGVCEEPKGSNKGKQVEAYLKAVGLGGGNPWCMAFVVWCCKQAGLSAGVPKTGSVMVSWKSCKAAYRAPKSDPKPGDIIIFDHGGGKGHTGIVEAVEGSIIKTIEGNSNDDGSREGYEVCRQSRNRFSTQLVGFIRVA